MIKGRIKQFILNRKIKKKKCRIESDVHFDSSCQFEGANYLSNGSYLNHTIMGYGSYIATNCILSHALIGRYTCIGPNLQIAAGRHPTSGFVSIHPMFYSICPSIGFSYVDTQKFQELKYALTHETMGDFLVVIGNDVWIGAGVTILDGVSIGDGAIIAAGSVVTKDVAPYSIVAGVSAKEKQKRFSDEEIERLMNIKWWDRDREFIAAHADCFEDINDFFEVFES